MSNIATQTTSLVNVRAVGSKNQAGEQFGGVYYPAHTKNGKFNSACWKGNVALNGKPYTDNNGVLKEGKVTYLQLVVWNGKNSAPGKGLADTFAKCVSVGKELSCNVRIESFDKRLFINGVAQLDQAGNAITYRAINFVFEDKLIFGADSGKVIASEIANYVGNSTFDSRPQFWNVHQHSDQVAWSTVIVPARMASVWDGQADRYGYARVIVTEGAVVGGPQMAATPGQAATAAPVQAAAAAPVQTPGQAAAAAPVQTGPVSGAAPLAAAQQLMVPSAPTPPMRANASTPL